jgi:hypothetical protein
VSQFHTDTLVERDEQMLADTEDKQPHQHDGKAGRRKTDKEDSDSAQQIGKNRKPARTQKKEKRGKKYNQESR